MILPEFDHKKASWDRWRAFYIDHNRKGPIEPMSWGWTPGSQFTQFDTGELICTTLGGNKDRGKFPHLNLEIVLATAANETHGLEFTTPGGEAVPHAWFTRDTVLMIDWDLARAYRVKGYTLRKSASVPHRFTNRRQPMPGNMYWAGEGAEPVGGEPIELTRPRQYTEEEKAKLKGFVLQAKMWLGVLGDDGPMIVDTHHPKSFYLKHEEFWKIPSDDRIQLVSNQFAPERTTFEVPYLNVTRKE